MKTIFKITLLLMMANLCRAQALQMQKGQPFPYESGLALSQSTADSTRLYVGNIKSELVREKAKSLDLSMKLHIKTFEHTNQTSGYQGLQESYKSLSEESQNYHKIKRRRFWLGFSVGILTTSLANYIKRNP